MVKKNKRKILFIICEGTSDDVTLHRSIDNFINSGIRYIKVETTDGDMAYKENISEENCIEYVNNIKMLDLCYEEDSHAKVDMNLVMTDAGEFIELQGTGEESPFSRKELNELLALGEKGIKQMIQAQKDSLKMDSLWIGTGESK
jgi:exosome complex RNA-binding protein Rrp42 (RNase PH superfamily)